MNKNNVDHIDADDIDTALKMAKRKMLITDVIEDNIKHKFGDHHYWYLVPKDEHSIEGQLMDHCGAVSSANEMYSLRDSEHKPHVTIEYRPSEVIIEQIRGPSNNLPDKNYWEYIAWFVADTDALVNDERSEDEDDFLSFITKDGGRHKPPFYLVREAESLFEELEGNIDIPYDRCEIVANSAKDDYDDLAAHIGVQITELRISLKEIARFDRKDSGPLDYMSVIESSGDGAPVMAGLASTMSDTSELDFPVAPLKTRYSKQRGLPGIGANQSNFYGEFQLNRATPEDSEYVLGADMFTAHIETEEHAYDMYEWAIENITEKTRKTIAARFLYEYLHIA